MEPTQAFIEEIRGIVNEFSKPFGTGSVLWYQLKWYKNGSHSDDINKLAGYTYPKIDALCLITSDYYPFDPCALVIVYEGSEIAKQEHFSEQWHDEISMTDYKKSRTQTLLIEDYEQTSMIIDCGTTYNFHLWKSPRRIKSVTDRCKNFGDIWVNGTLIHEGNKYGDHEHFYVIGSIHWKKYRS